MKNGMTNLLYKFDTSLSHTLDLAICGVYIIIWRLYNTLNYHNNHLIVTKILKTKTLRLN